MAARTALVVVDGGGAVFTQRLVLNPSEALTNAVRYGAGRRIVRGDHAH
jgi:hypothetical protein